MDISKSSECFQMNKFHFKILGIWPVNMQRYPLYNYYATLFVFVFIFMYNASLLVNFYYTPREIAGMIEEVVFLFTEVTIIAKVFMVLLKQKKIFGAFDILNCDAFHPNNKLSKEIIEEHVFRYKLSWKMYVMVLGHISYIFKVFTPVIAHFIFNSPLELPIVKYYFLDKEIIRRYFVFLYIYQSAGLYFNMLYNLNVDTLIAGLLYMALAQVKVLKKELANLKVIKNEGRSFAEQDADQVDLLNKHLKHYEIIQSYCNLVQDIIGVTMFVQFSMGSVMICIELCRLIMPWTLDFFLFMITYLAAIVLEIFIPSWLGTKLSYESAGLASAVYSSDWIPRSERYKRSVKLFMTRANTNIVITGWRIFPLSLGTFVSIMKLAYSFFTIINTLQES